MNIAEENVDARIRDIKRLLRKHTNKEQSICMPLIQFAELVAFAESIDGCVQEDIIRNKKI